MMHDDAVLALAFSRDGELLVSGARGAVLVPGPSPLPSSLFSALFVLLSSSAPSPPFPPPS